MKQGPQVAVAFQYDMRTAAPVAAVGSAQRGELIAHEMLVPRTAVTAAAEDPYLVHKIALLQNLIFI